MKTLSWVVMVLCLTTKVCSQERLGKHTVDEWRHIIDTTWGSGETTEEKLRIFDLFWNAVDQQYAGFNGIQDRWQELRSYRDTVALGVSRGRFAGICGHLVGSLFDVHMGMSDIGVSTTPLHTGLPLLYPLGIDMPSYNWGASSHFGAALTPLTDSTLLVYAAIANHPLGLVPGDVVLGYDGRLWKDLLKPLLKVQFPIATHFVASGSARANAHQWLHNAGMNWHLFDTIDIAKYGTADTLHLPTSLLAIPMPAINASEQMPVAGVPFPDVASGRLVSWGYINGTKIGYIYAWGWTPGYVEAFLPAVNSLMPDGSSDGLIIDLRLNEGGASGFVEGFCRLFNQDLEPMRALVRASPTDHLALSDNGPDHPLAGTDRELYDRPIAVLCGPAALSGGDKSVHLLRQHPMVRTFGLPTNGSFSKVVSNAISGIPSGWHTNLCWAVDYSPPDPVNLLHHTSVPVDEEVWLTRDGVAKGEDAVVKRAREWITTLAYARNVSMEKSHLSREGDSVCVTARISNPLAHALALSAEVCDETGTQLDSLPMCDDGAHGDSIAGDGIWGARILTQAGENTYAVSIQTADLITGTYRRLPSVAYFTTSGPVVCMGETASVAPAWGKRIRFRFLVANSGETRIIPGVTGVVRSLDTSTSVLYGGGFSVGDLLPGQSAWSGVVTVSFGTQGGSDPRLVPFELVFSSNAIEYWRDTIRTLVMDVDHAGEGGIPATCRLEQNYPNPFNPSTTIRYGLPNRSRVILAVFNTLGQRVALLQNGEQEAGYHEAKFDANGLSSGVYFYRLSAGEFMQTKKLLLVH